MFKSQICQNKQNRKWYNDYYKKKNNGDLHRITLCVKIFRKYKFLQDAGKYTLWTKYTKNIYFQILHISS